MRLAHIREAPLIRANLLLSQEKSKKSYKTIQPEITKVMIASSNIYRCLNYLELISTRV